MALRARAAGGPSIALQVLVYPVTDCDPETTSYLDPANQLILSRESMMWFWNHYAPANVPVRHRRFAGQMHGFFTMVDALPGAADGLDYVVAAIDEHLRLVFTGD